MNDLVTPWALENACRQNGEFVERVRRASQSLIQHSAQGFSGTARLTVATTLSSLADDFENLLQVKRTSGYFDAVASANVASSEVSRIRSGGTSLHDALLKLARGLEQRLTAREFQSSFADWLRRFAELEQTESRLIHGLWSVGAELAV